MPVRLLALALVVTCISAGVVTLLLRLRVPLARARCVTARRGMLHIELKHFGGVNVVHEGDHLKEPTARQP
eukprot:2278371-Pleurochrysis_carterae.AAC.1